MLGFSPELIARLLDAYPGTIAGTKDSAGDRTRIERICKDFPQLTVFAGTEKFLLDTLRWGGDGCISATVNLTARQARAVYDRFAAGEDASAAQAELTGVREFLDGFPAIPAMKAALRAQIGDDVWRNLRPPLDALDRARVRELLAGL